jgi:hypothetical protein
MPDGSGGESVSPEGSVNGLGGGREVKWDKRDKGCLIGGDSSARAEAFDCRSGIREAVSRGSRGIGSWRI